MERRHHRISGYYFGAVIGLCLLCGRAQADVLPGIPGIEWTVGPARVALGTVGTFEVPAGYRFTGTEGSKKFNELNENLSDSGVTGVLIPPLEQFADPKTAWYIAFSYADIGYVKDDEKDSLDAAAILEAIRKGNDTANAGRLKRGWSTLQVVGWQQKPAYDSVTHHLTWAPLGADAKGSQVVNYHSRILGRPGVIEVNLVLSPEQLASTIPTCRMIESQIGFVQGQTYQEFRTGDKIAKIGLMALITGGGAAVAIKSWKPLLVAGAAVVAFFAAIGRIIKSLFTRKSSAAALATGAPSTGIVICPRCQQKNRVAAGSQGAVCGHCKMPLS